MDLELIICDKAPKGVPRVVVIGGLCQHCGLPVDTHKKVMLHAEGVSNATVTAAVDPGARAGREGNVGGVSHIDTSGSAGGVVRGHGAVGLVRTAGAARPYQTGTPATLHVTDGAVLPGTVYVPMGADGTGTVIL